MDEKKVSEQMEDVLKEKIEEFSNVGVEADNAKEAAEALNKAADAYVKLHDDERKKWDNFHKILGIIVGGLGVVGAAVVKAFSDQKIADKQLEYLNYEHGRAYQFEEEGKTEHMVTSPAAKDALRERPKNFK